MQQPEVVSIGSLLVEIMRKGLDQPMSAPADFAGPYPSGDCAIYVDTVARLEHSAGFIGTVGRDEFGHCLLDRFERDHVDASQVAILPDETTGVAFVAYFSGGNRKFIYHWRHAAAGRLGPQHVRSEYLERARWLHLTGCNMAASSSAKVACMKAMQLLPPDACLSFDANLRPELLTIEEIRELVQPVVQRATVILPSLTEAAMLTGLDTDEEGCRLWAAQGKTVVLKMGPRGCRIYSGDRVIDVPGFAVEEVDPTGAGDSFSAGFTVAMLENMPLEEAGRFANAVGALAVTRLGPMEGAPSRHQVVEFLLNH